MLCACVVLVGAGGSPAARSAARAAARTPPSHPRAGRAVVSVEFDHAFSDQLAAVALANREGLKVTLFAMSGRVGLPGYMTAEELRALQARGNEIGGHTIDHADLSQLSPGAQQHEICGDRAALQADGLAATDFAYPYGHLDAATPGIARGCGYLSARGAGGLASQGGCYGACPPVESTPPANRFDTRTVNSVLDTTSLQTMEAYVARAERHGGGWVQIVFHYVCDRCDPYSVAPGTLADFLSWLAARQRAHGGRDLRVETVHQVIDARSFVPTPLPGRQRQR